MYVVFPHVPADGWIEVKLVHALIHLASQSSLINQGQRIGLRFNQSRTLVYTRRMRPRIKATVCYSSYFESRAHIID